MEEYIRVVQGLLAGETLEWTQEEKRKKIRFLDPGIGAINIKDPIPLHISAFGPKGRRLTAKLGAGWINGTANVGHATAGIEDMKAAWREQRRDPAKLFSTATIGGCVLREGETCDTPRVKAQSGPIAVIALHSLAEREEFGDLGRPVPPQLAALVERYHEHYLKYQPADARYLTNHRGHLMYLKPEEQQFCTPELIRFTTWTAPKAELRERLRELRRVGYRNFGVNIGYRAEGKLEEWAEVFEGV